MARIGIVATAVAPGRTGGAETYIRHLLECSGFHRLLSAHEVLVYCPTPADQAIIESGFTIIPCAVDARKRNERILWEQFHLPKLLKADMLDMVHFPYTSSCPAYRKPQVVTVHDTTNYVMPKSVSRVELIYKRILQHYMANNDKAQMIAVSETDRAILASRLRVPQKRTHVVYHGSPEDFLASPDKIGEQRPVKTLFWAGRPYYHKNVDLLIHMMVHLRKILGEKTPTMHMVGLDQANIKRLTTLSQELGIASFVQLEGPVIYNQLPQLMQRASVFVFPSLYESFGLPTLEAMCSGTPVVCSDLPVFREILGDSAVFADPQSPKAFAEGCAELVCNASIWKRFAQAGFARQRNFTWDKCAQDTVAVYETALQKA